jgi:small nuclear ribonucleoprotein (snRNP)-like protein
VRRVVRSHLRHRLVVTLKSGEAFDGVLFEADPEAWVLRNANAVGHDGKTLPVDGEVLILTADIAFAQRP